MSQTRFSNSSPESLWTSHSHTAIYNPGSTLPSAFDALSLLPLGFEVQCSSKTLVSTNETFVLSGNPRSKQMYFLGNIRAAVLGSFRGGAPTRDRDPLSHSLSLTLFNLQLLIVLLLPKRQKEIRNEAPVTLFYCFLRFLGTDVICGGGKGEHANYSTLCSQ